MRPRASTHTQAPSADRYAFAASLPGGFHLAFPLPSGPSCPDPGLVPEREIQVSHGLWEGPVSCSQPHGDRATTAVSLTLQSLWLQGPIEGHPMVAPTGSNLVHEGTTEKQYCCRALTIWGQVGEERQRSTIWRELFAGESLTQLLYCRAECQASEVPGQAGCHLAACPLTGP